MSEKVRVIGTAGGAFGLGAFAAAIGACCGLPWAVALLGVSGAVALARLSFLLPYALFVGAGALLAVGFWWTYRPAAVCADGTCNPERSVYAWNVWLVYGPEAKLIGAGPPRPRLLMHQLGTLRGSTEFPHLDSQVFAQQVQTLLAELPTSTGTAALAHQPQQ
jgi:hypothetical protein